MSLEIHKDAYGGTVAKSETFFTTFHVEPLQHDPLTPVLVAFQDYETNVSLTVDETRALIDALELALTVLK
jgi:hypothetical protein